MSKQKLAALAISLVSILAALPITIVGRAFAQQAPVCQSMPQPSSVPRLRVAGQPSPRECAQWQCAQRGKCQVLGPGQRIPITSCPPSCTPGQSEYETVFEMQWTEGCLKWSCAAVRMPDCPSGHKRIGGRCVPDQARLQPCPENYVRMAGRCVPNQQRQRIYVN
jgi:hypothetical protein